MAAATLNTFLRQLTRTMAAGTLADLTDRQLVEQFLARREEAVFEALVRRHGPMVYRVCRRVLRQEQDAEDAFQATFLVAAQNLRAVRKRASLASWLHGVAHRVALKAKAQAAARRRHDRQAPAAQAGPSDEVPWGELRSVLDAELAQLPEKWRQPLILCYLEGRTQDEAAGQLGWGKNTLRRRLDEARAALGRRLRRRGVWPAALAAVLLSDCVTSAALPPGLVPATVAAAARVAAGEVLTAAASAEVVALVEGVRSMIVLTKVKTALALLAAVGFLAAAACMSSSRALPEPPAAPEKTGTPALAKEPQGKDNPDKTADALAGRWVLTLPAGFTYPVVVRSLGEKRFDVENAVRFSGVYELREGRLVLVKPTTPGEKGFEWEVRGAGEIVLVAQPPVGKIGSNYLGATLKRPGDGKEPPKQQAAKDGVSQDDAPWVRALEQIKAEYRLKKEPAYRATPQYCLVLLGGTDPTRLWLVSDGATLYVDRNGNGDLTEPGEAVPFKPEGFAAFMAKAFPADRGGIPHTNLHIGVRQRDWEKDQGGHWAVRIDVEGRYPMYALVHKFAKKSEDAPVLHLGGPLRMGLYELEHGSLVRGRPSELSAYVVCQYPGVEKAFVDVDKWDRKDIHPVAEVRLPPKAAGAEPTVLRVPLARRC